MQTYHTITAEEKAELQMLVDRVRGSVTALWGTYEYYDKRKEARDFDVIKRIAEILGLEVDDE